MDDYEPYISEFEEIESSLGSAGMGTDEYYRPAEDIDSFRFKHASIVDPEQFGFFSDLFKDDYGFRPRFFVTIDQVNAWLKDRRISKDKARWPESY